MDKKLIPYIKSGEFTFCSRCGKNVNYGNKDFMCTPCTQSLFSKKMTDAESGEYYLKVKYESGITQLISQHREELAELRQNNLTGV